MLLVFVNRTGTNPRQWKLFGKLYWAFSLQFVACSKAVHAQRKEGLIPAKLILTGTDRDVDFILWRVAHLNQWYSAKNTAQ